MPTPVQSHGTSRTQRSQQHDSQQTHTVRRGETMDSIAKKLGVSLQDLIRANPQIRNPNDIDVGQHVNVPHAGHAAPPAARSARSTGRTAARQAELDHAPTTRSSGTGVPRGQTRAGGTPKGAAPRATTQTNRTEANQPAAGAPPNGHARFERVSAAGQRNQMESGHITVNGHTYQFNSGGHGRGNLPAGDYTVTPFKNTTNQAGMVRDGVGFSFALSDKYDSRVGGTRSLLRIHPDGGTAGTQGCIGIVGDAATLRQFRDDMNAEIRRNGGRYTLHVGN